MNRVAVVILNWNGETLLREFLPSVVAYTSLELADVVVVDNGSTDGSVALLRANFPEVRVVLLGENYGFSEGYNRALREMSYEYVVLLNSDVAVTPHWLEPLVEYLDSHADVVACQPKIRSYRAPEYFEYAGASGGFIDSLGYPYCRGRLFDEVERDEQQYDDVVSVFWASGASLCIRLKEYIAVGGLDDAFFAHMEEIDLCWRLKSRGMNLVCVPQSTVYHLGAATLSQSSPHKTYLNFRNNLLMLYKNLPQGKLCRVLTFRLLLDVMALLQYKLKGEGENSRAVMRAISDFYTLRKAFKTKRKENLASATRTRFDEVYGGSIVFDYFVRKKRRIDL